MAKRRKPGYRRPPKGGFARSNKSLIEIFPTELRQGTQPAVQLPPGVDDELVIDCEDDMDREFSIVIEYKEGAITEFGRLAPRDDAGAAASIWPFESVSRSDLAQAMVTLIVPTESTVGLYGA